MNPLARQYMKASGASALLSAWAGLFYASAGVGQPVEGHPAHKPHHGGTALYLAQLQPEKTVPPARTGATGTGVFIVDPKSRRARYELTFTGLDAAPSSIAVYNFGAGGNGELVRALCGRDATPCPADRAGRIDGQWDAAERAGKDASFLRELATGRLYVQVNGPEGKPELRAQLEPNGAMTPVSNFVASLAARDTRESKAVGTAMYSEVQLPNGVVRVLYHVTIAGATSEPTSAAVIPVRGGATTMSSPAAIAKFRLPEAARSGAERAPGGTLSGSFEIRPGSTTSPFTVMNQREWSPRRLVVSTRRFPEGELVGELVPVQ